MAGNELTSSAPEQAALTAQCHATKNATIAVVWSDGPARRGAARLLNQLDEQAGPWALMAPPGGIDHPACRTLPVCHSRDAARSWLQRGNGLVYCIDPDSEESQGRELIRLAGVTRAALLPIYLPTAEGGARLGARVAPGSLEHIESERRRVQVLKWRGQALRFRQPRPDSEASTQPHERVVSSEGADTLWAELEALPDHCQLLGSPDFRVYAAQARQIPKMLREIGRQREITFRAAGEGTGRSIDLDPFDQDYYHLFAYSTKQRELVGAYRLGLADEIVKTRGIAGLYTSTLFKYPDDLFDRLGATIELGRSFVCPEYQKTSRALLWLWKGIASFVARRPSYRTLLGPVSVSADYVSFSRELMVRVLSGSGHRHPLYQSVRPKNPVRARSFGAGGLGDPRAVLTAPSDLSAVVSDAEMDRKGLPVLLKEYLKLGGKFLGFNLDHEFSNVIDGLVVVDLVQTDRRLLKFYMGDLLQDFLDHHRFSA